LRKSKAASRLATNSFALQAAACNLRETWSFSMNIAAPFPTTKPEDVGLSRQGLKRLSQSFQREIDSGHLPGAVTLVSRRGRVAHFEAQGVRDPANPGPMQKDTIFRIYSMTKPVVSIAIAMMVEEGRLLVSDPLSKYIPEFADMQVATEKDGKLEYVPARRPITIQDLLRHTSGLTYEITGTAAVQKMYADNRVNRTDWTCAEHAVAIAKLPLFCQPGTEWNYSRSTDILGRVLEVAGGKTLGECLAERIFEPLGMVDTAFFVPPEKQSRAAEPFAKDPDSGATVRLLRVSDKPKMESGGGGLFSTTADYARFCQMLSNWGRLADTRIVSRKTLEWMAADHLGPKVKIIGDLVAPGHGFGLGFAVRRDAGLAPSPGSVGQYYWGGLAGTAFWIDPREELYAVMMVQAPGRREYYRTFFRDLVYAAFDD
jgi:CubicO group peptidase (beta-lactamase class C family)